MSSEYRAWPEFAWTAGDFDNKRVENVVAGVDVGTTSAQAAVFADGKMIGNASVRIGADFGAAADAALENALGNSGLIPSDIDRIVATGFGSRNVSRAKTHLNEIKCHAKGARFMFGKATATVVDLGGHSCAAIRLYERDRVRDFAVNDKCASGMGRSVEIMADLFQVPLTEIGDLSFGVGKDPEPVSTTCYNFAIPETINLFRPGYKEDSYNRNDALAAFVFAIAWRTLGMIGKLSPLEIGDIQIYGGLAFTGGLAKNRGVTERIERELGVIALRSDIDPQLAGAIGAALLS